MHILFVHQVPKSVKKKKHMADRPEDATRAGQIKKAACSCGGSARGLDMSLFDFLELTGLTGHPMLHLF